MSNSTLIQKSLTGKHFGYSATSLDDLNDSGATEYTLVTIVVDESSSVSNFKVEMEQAIKEIVESCKTSPRSDFLLIRLVAFNQQHREIHGFKRLIDCDLADYDGCLHPGGTTLLFATTENAIDAINDYGKDLAEGDYDVNAIVVIITDGMDNESEYQTPSVTAADVKRSLTKAIRDEQLESILTILVGVGVGEYADVQQYLDDFKMEAQITQYVSVNDATASELAKLAKFVSKSISSQSSALGSGGCSQPLNF